MTVVTEPAGTTEMSFPITAAKELVIVKTIMVTIVNTIFADIIVAANDVLGGGRRNKQKW